MTFFRKQFPGRRFRIYPFGDIHYGSPQCNLSFVKKYLKMIEEDPIGYWVGMGDLMENAIIGSKSDVYTQTDPPEEQAKFIAELLKPIKEKGLFLIKGNHEQRSHREVGMAPEEYISAELGRRENGERWVPVHGFSCYARLELPACKNPWGFKCYFHHSKGGGSTEGGKVNVAVKLRERVTPTADAVFSAHSHITNRTPITWYELGRKQIIKRVGYHYICGSALDYSKSYAEEKGYRPATMEFIRVTFIGNNNGRKDNRDQRFEVIRPDPIEEEI